MIKDLITKVIEVNDSLTSKLSEKGAVTKAITKIPTLKQSYYRPISPMLKER